MPKYDFFRNYGSLLCPDPGNKKRRWLNRNQVHSTWKRPRQRGRGSPRRGPLPLDDPVDPRETST